MPELVINSIYEAKDDYSKGLRILDIYARKYPQQAVGLDLEKEYDKWVLYERFKKDMPKVIEGGAASEINPFKKGDIVLKKDDGYKKEKIVEPSPDMVDKLLSFSYTDYLAEGFADTHDERNKLRAEQGLEPLPMRDDVRWMQESFNESAAGTTWTIKHGEPKYDVEEVDRNWLSETAQLVFGMLNPVDLAILRLSGGLGNLALKGVGSKYISSYALKGMGKLSKDAALKYLPKASQKYANRLIGREALASSAFNMFGYGAAMGALNESANQSMEIEATKRGELNPATGLPYDRTEFDAWKIIWGGTKEGTKSGILGAAAGFSTKGLMMPKFAQLKMQTPAYSNKIAKLLTHPSSQLIAEGAIFGTGHYGLEALPRVLNGEINPKTGKPYTLSFEDWAENMLKSTAVIYGIRAMHGKFGFSAEADVAAYKNARLRVYKEGMSRQGEGYSAPDRYPLDVSKDNGVMTNLPKNHLIEKMENVVKTFEDANLPVPKEVFEKLAELNNQEADKMLGIDLLETSIKDFNALMKEHGVKDVRDLPKDVQGKMLTDLSVMNNGLYEFYSELKANKPLAYEIFKAQLGDKASFDKETQLKIDALLKSKMEHLKDVNKMLNEGALNNPDALKDMQSIFGDGFNYRAVRTKDGRYELEMRTPNLDSKLELPDMLKFHKTEKSAMDFGEALKQRYKERLKGEDSKPHKKSGLGEEVSIIRVNPSTKAPMVDNVGNPIKSRVPKSEAEAMINEGTAVYPKDINVNSGVDMNSRNFPKEIQELVTDVKDIKKTQQITAPVTAEMPMPKPAYDRIKLRTENILNETLPKDAITEGEKVFIKMKNRKGNNPVADALPNMTEVNKNAFVDFATWHFGNVISKRGMGKIPGQKVTVNEISRFLSDLSKEGKDVSTMTIEDIGKFFDKYRTKAPSTTRADAMTKFTDFITRKKYIDVTIGSDLLDYAKSKFTETNEYIAEGTAPAKKKVRTKSIELAENTGDMGIEIAAKIGARFYLRPQEVNALSKKIKDVGLEKALKFDKDTGEYYLDLKVSDGTAKSGTFDRYIYIDKGTANLLLDYINNGGSLTGKMSKVGQLIKNDAEINSGNVTTFNDYRKRAKSTGAKINYHDQSIMDYMLGHNKNRIDGIYKELSVGEHIEFQKELHKKLNSPIEEIKPTKDIIELHGGFGITPESMRVLRKGLIETGKFLYKDLPRYMRRSGTKLGINKDNFIDMYKKVESGAKGMSKGVTNWFKGVMTHMGRSLKTAGTSIRKYVEDYIESPKIGASIEVIKSKPKFKNAKAYTNSINRYLRIYTKEVKGTKHSELVEFIATEAGIENPSIFKVTAPKEGSMNYDKKMSELDLFYDKMNELNVSEYANRKDLVKWNNEIKEIEDYRTNVKSVTTTEQRSILKDIFGVEDGLLIKASDSQRAEYRELISNDSFKHREKNRDYKLDEELNRAAEGTKFEKLVTGIAKYVAPAYVLFDRYGLKSLREKSLTHASYDVIFQKGLSNFNRDVLREVGTTTSKALLNIPSELRARNIKNDMVMALDYNGRVLMEYLKWLGDAIPNKDKKRIRSAKKFFDKAVKREWWDTVKEGKGADLRKKKNGEYIYLDSNTMEGRLAISFIKNISDYYGKDRYRDALRLGVSEAEYEASADLFKFIEGGIHVTRSVTSPAQKVLNVRGKARDRALDRIAMDMAIKTVKKRHGEGLTQKQIKEKLYEGEPGETIIDIARQRAEDKLMDGINYNSGKMELKYFKDRYTLQDVYVKNKNGKLIRTYENTFDDTVLPYVQGMSKFYATIAVFPDVVRGLKPGNNMNKLFNPKEFKRLMGKDVEALQIVEKALRRQIGFEKDMDAFSEVSKVLSMVARTTVISKLSAPVTFVNNILYSLAAKGYAYKLRYLSRGFLDVIRSNVELIDAAREAGVMDVGTAHYEGQAKIAGVPVDLITQLTLMKTGGIKPSEQLMRLWDVATAKYDQANLFERLDTYHNGSKQYKQARDAIKTRYELTNSEINLRQKYHSVEDIKNDLSLTKLQKAKTITEWNAVRAKMNYYAHVNVEGSSAHPFMPHWTGGKLVRPLLVFQSMAYANTVNTGKHSKHALKYGNYGRLLIGTTGHLGAGMFRLFLMKQLWNAEAPDETSPLWQRLKTMAWYGSMGGILSAFYSPYARGFADDMHPAIGETLYSFANEIRYGMKGDKPWLIPGDTRESATGSFIKDNIMLYSFAKKIYERNPLFKGELNSAKIRFSNMKSEWQEEDKGILQRNVDDLTLMSGKQLAYKNLKNAFFLSDKEDFHQTLVATVNELVADRINEEQRIHGYEKGFEKAYEYAWKQVESQYKKWNPNPGTLKKETKSGKAESFKFITWAMRNKEGAPDRKWITSKGREGTPPTGEALKLWTDMMDAESLYEERITDFTVSREIMEYAAANNMLDHVKHLSTYSIKLKQLYHRLEKKYIKKYGKDS